MDENKEIKRTCNTCRFEAFSRCEELKENAEYQSIYSESGVATTTVLDRITATHKFKENHVCDEYACKYIQYPLEISAIDSTMETSRYKTAYTGKFVAVRPCAEKYENKTFLGIMIGELPWFLQVSHVPETKVLSVLPAHNPAMLVFDTNEIIFGAESWWSVIKSEEDLQAITDADIDNVFYVKALKYIAEGK